MTEYNETALIEALQQERVDDADDDGFRTVWDIVDALEDAGTPHSDTWVRQHLAKLKRKGRIEIRKVQRERLDGMLLHVPAYRVKD